MLSKRFAVVIVALCSFGFFIAAFSAEQFVKSEFTMPKHQSLTKISVAIDSPCQPLCTGINNHLPAISLPSWASTLLSENCTKLCQANEEHVDNMRDVLLDRMLGGMPSPKGELVSWKACMSTNKSNNSFENCLESWVLSRAGMPIGTRSYGSIVKDVFANNLMLGVMIVIFSALLPVVRIGLTILLVFDSTKTIRKAHKYVAKFSMTEVLLVAFVITFFKAESFSFQMSFEIGSWFFIAGTVALWIGDWLTQRLILDKS